MSHTYYDIIDEGNLYLVKVDALGIKKNEIKINVTENSLDVSVEHKESENKKKNYLKKNDHILLRDNVSN